MSDVEVVGEGDEDEAFAFHEITNFVEMNKKN